MATDPATGKCMGEPVQFGGSASEPTATLTRMQAIRAYHTCHPDAGVEEIIRELCNRGLLVDEEMIAQAMR